MQKEAEERKKRKQNREEGIEEHSGGSAKTKQHTLKPMLQ